jgi:hypothetical protein
MMCSLQWQQLVVVSISILVSWVQEASSFVTQPQQPATTQFGILDPSTTIFSKGSTIIRPPPQQQQQQNKKTTTLSSLSATVNGDGTNAGSTAVPSRPGFPLHSLFSAAAKAAVPKAPDTETGAHDAVSESCCLVDKKYSFWKSM